MDNGIIDINRECYELAKESEWNITLLRYNILHHSLYKFGLNKLSLKQVIINALVYAKKCDYVDTIVRKIARKNGRDLAYSVFKTVFPDFDNVTDLYDYCYKLCEKNDDLKEISKKIGISVLLIKYYSRESKLGLTKEDAQRIERRKNRIENKYPVYYSAIKFLYEHDKLEDIITYFENIDVNIEKKILVACSSSMFPDKTPNDLREMIYNKYDKYVNYKKSVIDVDKNSINNASMVIKKFVDGIYPNILSFCTIEKIDKKKFRSCLAIVKMYNWDLYKQYQEKALKIKNNEYSISFPELKKIVEYIAYGIDGRCFTLLDYYKLTNYDLNVFYHLVENSLNEEEYHAVVDFYRKYKNMRLLTEEYILNEKREFYCDLDDKGFPISGTGHIVTDEEKKEIIKMIKNDGYKLYGPIYSLYLKNYFSEERRMVLKKSL